MLGLSSPSLLWEPLVPKVFYILSIHEFYLHPKITLKWKLLSLAGSFSLLWLVLQCLLLTFYFLILISWFHV